MCQLQGEQLQELGETPVASGAVEEESPICIVDELKLLIQDNEELTIKNRKLERDLRLLKSFVSFYRYIHVHVSSRFEYKSQYLNYCCCSFVCLLFLVTSIVLVEKTYFKKFFFQKKALISQENFDTDPLKFLESSNQLRRDNRKLREQLHKSVRHCFKSTAHFCIIVYDLSTSKL